MQITIVTLGSRGDVQPLVALGIGLKEAGYEVAVNTHQVFAQFVQDYGLGFAPISGNVHRYMQEMTEQASHRRHNAVKLFRQMQGLVRPEVRQMAQDCWQACQKADALVLGGLGFFAGETIAAVRGIPYIQTFLQPAAMPTKEFPSAMVPALGFRNPLYNRLSHKLVQQLLWQVMRPMLNEVREEMFGLPAWPLQGPYAQILREQRPILLGHSVHVIPYPEDWLSMNIHVTGFWFLNQAVGWQPPRALERFLASGSPPVYVGFGSMTNQDAEESTKLVLRALEMAGQRGILLKGWGGFEQADLPETVWMVESVPHDWLFPRMAAVVHHGGAGTTATGLWAGVPSIIIPFFSDQPFWGNQVYRLGVGPKPIPRHKLTVEGLAQAIYQAVNDQPMQLRAAALGARLQAEDGVGYGVQIIDKYLHGVNLDPAAMATLNRKSLWEVG